MTGHRHHDEATVRAAMETYLSSRGILRPKHSTWLKLFSGTFAVWSSTDLSENPEADDEDVQDVALLRELIADYLGGLEITPEDFLAYMEKTC